MKWLLIFFSFPLFAAYVGNPADPALMSTGLFSSNFPFFKFTSGYIADYTSDKRYETDQGETPHFDPNRTFKRFGLHSQLATVSAILFERFQVFGSVGGSRERAKWYEEPSVADVSAVLFDFESAYHFSWNVGSKLILFNIGPLYFSTDFTYFAIPSSPKSYFKFFNRLNLPMDHTKQKSNLREWQLSGGVSLKLLFLTPYVGGTYLLSRLHIQGGPETPPLNYYNDVKWGYFYGLTLSLTGRFHLNVERRLRDEFAYAFSTVAVF